MTPEQRIRKLKKIESRARQIADNSFRPAAEIPNMIADLAAILRDHRCWCCQDGDLPCKNGNPRQCEFPRARND